MFSLDSIDNGILTLLGKNSRSNAPKISKELSEMQISLTDSSRVTKNRKTRGEENYTRLHHNSRFIHISTKEHMYDTSQVRALGRKK